MSNTWKTLAIDNLSGGRNGGDPPLSIPEYQCSEAINVEWASSGLGRKRFGTAADGMTFSSGGPFVNPIGSLIRHVPAADDTAAELWAFECFDTPPGNVIGRKAGAATFAAVAATQAPVDPTNVIGASFNGKLFLAYDSTVDRLHVWDGTSLRLVGLGTPAVASVANTGSGSYAAVVRYYKVCYTVQVAGVTVRRSEPSTAVTFTPSGSGTAARVTKPASLSEGETHWELYGSDDNVSFWLMATTLVATTYVDDTAVPSLISTITGTAIPEAGTNTVPSSWKYVTSDGNRLVGAGSHESGGKNNRVWFSPVLGALNVGDDERVLNTATVQGWIDIDENDGGYVTGLVSAQQGTVYVFKRRQIWKLVTTGIDTSPYRPVCLTKAVGCLRHQTIVQAEDESGNPAIYFLSERGPYRLGVNGLQYCGRDVEDLWAASELNGKPHAVYHSQRKQVWFFVPAAGATYPANAWVLYTPAQRSGPHGMRGGWSRFNWAGVTGIRASVPFSVSAYSSGFSTKLVPYIAAGANLLWRTDQPLVYADAGATMPVAYITTRPLVLTPGYNFDVRGTHLLAKSTASTAVTVYQGLYVDFIAASQVPISTDTTGGRSSSVSLASSASRVMKQFEGSEANGCWVCAVSVGDAAASAYQWDLDALVLSYRQQEPR